MCKTPREAAGSMRGFRKDATIEIAERIGEHEPKWKIKDFGENGVKRWDKGYEGSRTEKCTRSTDVTRRGEPDTYEEEQHQHISQNL